MQPTVSLITAKKNPIISLLIPDKKTPIKSAYHYSYREVKLSASGNFSSTTPCKDRSQYMLRPVITAPELMVGIKMTLQ